MKCEQILFPLDFSDQSRAMTADVEWLSRHYAADVTLLHAIDVPGGWYQHCEFPVTSADQFLAYRDAERERLHAYRIDLPEARVRRVSIEGSPAYAIPEWVKENKVDLVVLGTHGFGPLKRLLIGSVAMNVLHEVDCPVWTHPVGKWKAIEENLGIRKILAAVDLTEEGPEFLRSVASIASDFGASVDLLHCVPFTPVRPQRYFDADLHRNLVALAEREIQHMQSMAGTDFAVSISEGLIAQDLAETVRSRKADIVVLGRGKAQSALGSLRSHVYEVIRAVPCPVLSLAHDAVINTEAVDAHADETLALKH